MRSSHQQKSLRTRRGRRLALVPASAKCTDGTGDLGGSQPQITISKTKLRSGLSIDGRRSWRLINRGEASEELLRGGKNYKLFVALPLPAILPIRGVRHWSLQGATYSICSTLGCSLRLALPICAIRRWRFRLELCADMVSRMEWR